MAVKVVFLGRLEDTAGAASRMADPGVLDTLIAGFESDLARAVLDERVRVAINGQLVTDRAGLVLADGDELAFLPPVSGG